MKRALACLFATVACQSGTEAPPAPTSAPPPEPAPASVSPPSAPRAPSPHGGSIVIVAVTDTGDAALTVDDLSDVRVWPRLDGSAPPVPIHGASAIAQVAIARTGEGLLAALRDPAGDVELVRLSGSGAELGRAQLPDVARYEQVALVGDTVLAWRSDERIARFDARGAPRGEVAAPPGEQIGTLAVRTGVAIAITGDAEHGFRTARELDLAGDAVRWGRAHALPHPTTGAVALSPSHKLLAIQNALDLGVEVIDVATEPCTVAGSAEAKTTDVTPQLGFVDDAHLAIAHSALEWWTPKPATPVDPWTIVRPPAPRTTSDLEVAIGDGVVAIPTAGSLQLVDYDHAHWLGYRFLFEPPLATDGAGHFVVGPADGEMLWLDAALQQTRAFTVPASDMATVQTAFALDGSHVLAVHRAGSVAQLDLYDADRAGSAARVAVISDLVRVEVDPEQHVAIAMAGSGGVERFRFDPATAKVTELPALQLRGTLPRVFVTDPARADGVAALALVLRDDAAAVDAYVEAPGASGPLAPASHSAQKPMFVRADGTTYEASSGQITIRRAGAKPVHVAPPAGAPAEMLTAVSHDGESLVFDYDHQVAVTDANGTVRWRVALWQFSAAVFSADDRELAIATPEGLLAFDTATGARLAAGCGWQFGLWTEPLSERIIGAAPLCAQ